jgi:2-iminobutanoate/2-iminopropanoate deaminase
MTVTSIDPDELPPAGGPFAHVTVAEGTRIVTVSGQVALDAEGALVGAGDPEEQARQCLRNVDRALAAAGMAREHVIRIGVYLTDIAQREAVARARMEYFGEHRPASTLFAVPALVLPELLVEIEATAVA